MARCTIAPFALRRLIGAALLVTISGCSKTATVSGKVTFRGHPVTHGAVVMLSANDKTHSSAIAPDGSYTINGVEPGDVRVAVISTDPNKARSKRPPTATTAAAGKNAPGKAAAPGRLAIPSRYRNARSSGLICKVEPGHVTYDIDLK